MYRVTCLDFLRACPMRYPRLNAAYPTSLPALFTCYYSLWHCMV